jgi:predicted membrane-bound mannosyltransferase
MKISGKPLPTSVGVGFVALALVTAILALPDANSSQSPWLYVCIIGGLFVGLPATLGIGVIVENIRTRRQERQRPANTPR